MVRFAPDRGDLMAHSGAQVAAITPRERDVLIALCRPAATDELFVEPASVREMATALDVTEAAIKQHLLNLYAKFGIGEGDERRRVALARLALRSGVIGLTDLSEARSRAVGHHR